MRKSHSAHHRHRAMLAKRRGRVTGPQPQGQGRDGTAAAALLNSYIPKIRHDFLGDLNRMVQWARFWRGWTDRVLEEPAE